VGHARRVRVRWLVPLVGVLGLVAPLPAATAATVRPQLTIAPGGVLADRATVEVQGTGFGGNTFVGLFECAWTDTIRCVEDPVGYGFTDEQGTFTSQAAVSRVVNGYDCARTDSRTRCHVWAFSDDERKDVATGGLRFDPSHPPVLPTASVTPTTDLLHHQEVTVKAAHFSPRAFVVIEECVSAGTADEECNVRAFLNANGQGALDTTAEVSRRVGIHDCAEEACVLRVGAPPLDRVDIPITFDASVPPPPVPSVTANPVDALVDHQAVDLTVSGAEPDSQLWAQICAPDDTCRGNVSRLLGAADDVVAMAVPRMIGSIDCAQVACAIEVQLFGENSYQYRFPVTFDPDAPLAPPADTIIFPAHGLWDRQRVEIRGDRWDPGAYAFVRQCTTVDAAPETCGSSNLQVQADSLGRLRDQTTVTRTLALPAGEADCVVVTCYLVVGDAPALGTALDFDPDGPVRGRDLPPQLPCVSWPTNGWPTGSIPAGVDAAAVEALGAQMVGPNGGDSVVVVHGGRLVYEKYRDGISADSILPSFSMSKSFTSTIIGQLVDSHQLSLDARAPIPEWSDPRDNRRMITLRNLLNMSSGLKFSEIYNESTSDVIKMIFSDDAAAYAIARPIDVAPGSQFHYSTGDTMVLSRIIADTANVSGDSYLAYLHEHLLDPLGMDPVDVGIDAAGNWQSGWFTNMSTRNFMKLGLLYMRDGQWDGQRIVSPEWVDFVRTPSPTYSGYGGQFWHNGDGSFDMVGFAGQNVHIVPALDLIVAVNNGGSADQMAALFRNAEAPSCGNPSRAVDDEAMVTPGSSVDIDVLANDVPGEGEFAPETLTLTTLPAQGSAAVVDGRIRFVAGDDAVDPVQFGYAVCTVDRRRCVEATVHVDIVSATAALRRL
jgi:CubicO group peptidase (beta-lactamase class C family)